MIKIKKLKAYMQVVSIMTIFALLLTSGCTKALTLNVFGSSEESGTNKSMPPHHLLLQRYIQQVDEYKFANNLLYLLQTSTLENSTRNSPELTVYDIVQNIQLLVDEDLILQILDDLVEMDGMSSPFDDNIKQEFLNRIGDNANALISETQYGDLIRNINESLLMDKMVNLNLTELDLIDIVFSKLYDKENSVSEVISFLESFIDNELYSSDFNNIIKLIISSIEFYDTIDIGLSNNGSLVMASFDLTNFIGGYTGEDGLILTGACCVGTIIIAVGIILAAAALGEYLSSK